MFDTWDACKAKRVIRLYYMADQEDHAMQCSLKILLFQEGLLLASMDTGRICCATVNRFHSIEHKAYLNTRHVSLHRPLSIFILSETAEELQCIICCYDSSASSACCASATSCCLSWFWYIWRAMASMSCLVSSPLRFTIWGRAYTSQWKASLQNCRNVVNMAHYFGMLATAYRNTDWTGSGILYALDLLNVCLCWQDLWTLVSASRFFYRSPAKGAAQHPFHSLVNKGWLSPMTLLWKP